MKMNKIGMTIALIAVVGIANTKADTLSYTATAGPSKTDWTVADGTLQPIQLQQFDPSLGILQEVDITSTLTFSTLLSVINNADSSSSGTASLEVKLSLIDAGNNFAGDNPLVDRTLKDSLQFTYSLNPGDSTTSSLITDSLTPSPYIYTDAAILAEFTGSGSVNANLGTSTVTWLSYTGGVSTETQTTTASGKITVTYIYEAVPEPSTWALLLSSGMLFLGCQRLRLRRR